MQDIAISVENVSKAYRIWRDPNARTTIESIAKRVEWWKPPAEVVKNTDNFLCRILALGLWEDVVFVCQHWSDEELIAAIQHAPSGLFDSASWNYWHHRLRLTPVPPLPQRTFL